MSNIIITGGGLSNKGAQAMTFICVDEIHKRWPDYKIFVQSTVDWNLPEDVKKQYSFEIIPDYGVCAAEWKMGGFSRLKCLLRGKKPNLSEVNHIYGNSAAIIDVSGYIFGANWQEDQVMDFLSRLYYAKAYKIPIYLMPQSFGPFPFTGKRAGKIDGMAKKLLPYAKIIFAREQDGYDALRKHYGLDNVRLTMDMVLNNQSVNPENIFLGSHSIEDLDISDGSVAIIPNSQNSLYGSQEELFYLYRLIVKHLLSLEKKVYLMRHSTGDIVLCRKIQNEFLKDERVILLENDFDCFQMGNILSKFDFVIASRYHSVVHSYKVGTPCLVLGWAIKYHDLMQSFGQERLFFDVREPINYQEIEDALDYLNNNCNELRKCIISQLAKYQELDIFEQIKL